MIRNSRIQFNRREVYIVRGVGETFRFEANCAAMRVRSAVHAFKTGQVVACIHDHADFGCLYIHSSAGCRADNGSSMCHLLALAFVKHEAMVITFAENQLLVTAADALADSMRLAEIERCAFNSQYLSSVVCIVICREIVVSIDGDNMVLD